MIIMAISTILISIMAVIKAIESDENLYISNFILPFFQSLSPDSLFFEHRLIDLHTPHHNFFQIFAHPFQPLQHSNQLTTYRIVADINCMDESVGRAFFYCVDDLPI